MTTYDNNLTGALFKNDDKREGKQDPDYRGQCEIDRKKFWIDAWLNTSKKDGRKYMKLKFKPQLAKDQDAVPHKEPERTGYDGPNDDIPF